MMRYEYKVIPAATRGLKEKGIKGAEARFAFAVQTQINAEAAEGWEYQRAEMLPSQERAGLTSTTTEWRHLLVFRREIAQEEAPTLLPPPEQESSEPEVPKNSVD
ncbi:MAG: DUF4177 domain-containing protein [Pseudomonadota bacterium]